MPPTTQMGMGEAWGAFTLHTKYRGVPPNSVIKINILMKYFLKNQTSKLWPIGWLPVFIIKVLLELGLGLGFGKQGRVIQVQGHI